jgi:hypothetical protein
VAADQSESEPVPLEFDQLEVIERDVAVIGGGSGGTYAAIRLRQLDKSVVVIEKEAKLGGHSNTYIDPHTGIPVEYGVKSFANTSVVINYFAHFDIPLAAENVGGNLSESVDFTTGKSITVVPIFLPPSDAKVSAALERYMGQLAKYPFLEDEYYHLSDPVPKDLLLPFGDFVAKHDLGAMVPLVAAYVFGFGDPLLKTTLYIMKTFNLHAIHGLQDGLVTYASHDNSELYKAAEKELGSDVLYQSTVTGAKRGINKMGNSSYILAHTPSGHKLIRAKKILITIPQTVENLMPFDLDKTEEAIFAQFAYTFYYTTVISNIYQSASVIYNHACNTPYNLPSLPGVYGIFSTRVPDLKWVVYGSSTFMTNEEVKRDLVDNLLRIRHPNITVTQPEVVAFQSHAPYELTVTGDAIQNGFYRQLEALQGHRGTCYTGAALTVHESAVIWSFTEKLLLDHFV